MPYIKRNKTTTLPTTLNPGEEVYYIDPNGVETLWVGREDGSAWPSVGYKEYVALLTQTGTNAPVATVLSNTLGNIVWTRSLVGVYPGTLNGAFLAEKTFFACGKVNIFSVDDPTYYSIERLTDDTVLATSQLGSNGFDSILASSEIAIRVYP